MLQFEPMESSQGAARGSADGSLLLDVDAELARLAVLSLAERGTGLAELARRLEAELDSTSAPLPDAEAPQ